MHRLNLVFNIVLAYTFTVDLEKINLRSNSLWALACVGLSEFGIAVTLFGHKVVILT